MKKLFNILTASALLGACGVKTPNVPRETVKVAFEDMSINAQASDIITRAKAKYTNINDDKQLDYFKSACQTQLDKIASAQASGYKPSVDQAKQDARVRFVILNIELEAGV